MDVEEFLELLRNHDWYYNYSDDHRAWCRGKAERFVIDNAMKDRSDLQYVYQSYIQEK